MTCPSHRILSKEGRLDSIPDCLTHSALSPTAYHHTAEPLSPAVGTRRGFLLNHLFSPHPPGSITCMVFCLSNVPYNCASQQPFHLYFWGNHFTGGEPRPRKGPRVTKLISVSQAWGCFANFQRIRCPSSVGTEGSSLMCSRNSSHMK